MNDKLRELVRTRADNRCEYCGLRQEHAPFASFQIEHIRAVQHGGGDHPENLALACQRCNAFKGPNLTGIDPETGEIEQLFDPRHHDWQMHFCLNGPAVVGLTATGRATVRVLCMNEERRIVLRQQLMDNGELSSPG
jgi:hypothetical protein